MDNEVRITTYGCACGYSLEIQQEVGQPTVSPLTETFYTRRGWTQRGLQVGRCYSCFLRGVQGELARIIDSASQSVMQVKDVSQVDAQTTALLDEHGNVTTEQVGIKEQKFIEGDQIVTREVEVMAPVHRELNDLEKQTEIDKIHRAEDLASLMEATA